MKRSIKAKPKGESANVNVSAEPLVKVMKNRSGKETAKTLANIMSDTILGRLGPSEANKKASAVYKKFKDPLPATSSIKKVGGGQ